SEGNKKENDELRLKYSSFFCRALWASEICVRRWKVRTVTCWFELSLLCGLLGSCSFLGALLAATLFRCFLSTFFSCHSFYVLVLSSLVLVFLHDHKIQCVLRSCGLE